MTSFSPSGLGSRFFPFGSVALGTGVISGGTIMNMIKSTSMTSIIGTTFGSDLTLVCPALPETPPAIGSYLLAAVSSAEPCSAMHVATAGDGLLGLEFLGEDRTPELAPDALDEVVDQLFRGVGHLNGEIFDLRSEVVVCPYCRNGDHKTKGGGDQRFCDTSGDAGQTAGGALRGHTGEGVHDTHRGAEKSHERGRRSDGCKDTDAALEVGKRNQHLALYGALGRIDVGSGDRSAVAKQRLHLGKRFTDDAGHVALLVLLSQGNCLVQVLFLNGARELGGELPGLSLRPLELNELLKHDRQRPDRHDRQHTNDELGEQAHRAEQFKKVYTHLRCLQGERSLLLLESDGLLHQL